MGAMGLHVEPRRRVRAVSQTEDGHSELAVGAECWLCGRVNCDCEASHPPQESSTTGPVTPKQRTIGIAQVTPDKADGCGIRKSLGSA